MGQQDGVADTMGQIVEPAQLVGHGVHMAKAGVVEGHAGQILGVAHLVTGLHVLAVGHGGPQVSGDQFDGLEGAGVGNRGGRGGNIGFHGVGQGIHAGGGGQCRGHAHHEQRVVDGHVGGYPPVHDGHFDLAAGVGDDAETGHLAGRSGGGVDGDERWHGLGGLVHALVITDVSTVGGDDADALATVVGAAAAQGNDQVALRRLVKIIALMHVVVRGVGMGTVVDHRIHTAFGLDHCCDLVGDTRRSDALVRADERLGSAEHLDLVADLFVGADAHQGNRGNEKSEYLLLYCHVCLLGEKLI
ncbi:hypothetical protein DESC_610322 [Desulfosarcina cetonica]|nr:hypothetical protein DESC_610322 [Desulfosarcina cetonica]